MSGQIKSGTTQDDSDYNTGSENMLDGLKLELGVGVISNPQGNDASFMKKQKEDTYRASVVFDENEEYDSEEEERGMPRRKSLKKARPSAADMQLKKIPNTPKLKNLLGAGGPSER